MKKCILSILVSAVVVLTYVVFTTPINIKSSKILKEDFFIETSRGYSYAYWNDERGKQFTPNGTELSIYKLPAITEIVLDDESVIFVEKLPKNILLYQKVLAKMCVWGFCNKRPSYPIGLWEVKKPWLKNYICDPASNPYGFSGKMQEFCSQ
jgi:hypothetical protein